MFVCSIYVGDDKYKRTTIGEIRTFLKRLTTVSPLVHCRQPISPLPWDGRLTAVAFSKVTFSYE